jgi:hypothetical protein
VYFSHRPTSVKVDVLLIKPQMAQTLLSDQKIGKGQQRRIGFQRIKCRGQRVSVLFRDTVRGQRFFELHAVNNRCRRKILIILFQTVGNPVNAKMFSCFEKCHDLLLLIMNRPLCPVVFPCQQISVMKSISDFTSAQMRLANAANLIHRRKII